MDVTADSLFSELLMLEGVEDRSIMLVEGEQDARFFAPFVNPKACTIITGSGKTVILGAAQLANANRMSNVIICADSDHIAVPEDPRYALPNVVRTDLNDIDAELFFARGVAQRIIDTHARSSAVEARLNGETVEDRVIELLRPIAALALYCRSLGLTFRYRDFPVRIPYIESPDLALDFSKFSAIGASSVPSGEITRDEVDAWLASGSWRQLELKKFMNGHHIVSVFHMMLKKWGGYNKSEENLPHAMRAALTESVFYSLPFVTRLQEWFVENGRPSAWKTSSSLTGMDVNASGSGAA